MSYEEFPLKKIICTAVAVKGVCNAGIKPGSKFVIEGGNLVLDECDVICPTALASINYRFYALQRSPKRPVSKFIQCPDPYIWGKGNGATVLFEITVEE